jgi:hypothetical protein
VDLRASLDELEKRKFLTLPNSDPLVVQPVASRYTDYAIPAHRSKGNTMDNVCMKSQINLNLKHNFSESMHRRIHLTNKFHTFYRFPQLVSFNRQVINKM